MRALSRQRPLQRPLSMIAEGHSLCQNRLVAYQKNITGHLYIRDVLEKGFEMRKDIHPKYVDCKVTCACGNEFMVKSANETMSIDICNECHPFFTGSEKIVDAAGRVEKFKSKYKLS